MVADWESQVPSPNFSKKSRMVAVARTAEDSEKPVGLHKKKYYVLPECQNFVFDDNLSYFR